MQSDIVVCVSRFQKLNKSVPRSKITFVIMIKEICQFLELLILSSAFFVSLTLFQLFCFSISFQSSVRQPSGYQTLFSRKYA